MDKYRLQPLSVMEKRVAEENYKIVYAFLRDRGYSVENFYGVAVIGYLKGVQKFCRDKSLQQSFDLFYVCWNYMRTEIENYFKMEKAQKRVPMGKICSMDAEYSETEDVLNLLIGKSVEDEYMEKIRFEELMEKLTEIQRVITRLKMDGFNNTEIYFLLKMPSSRYYREIKRIKSVLERYVA